MFVHFFFFFWSKPLIDLYVLEQIPELNKQNLTSVSQFENFTLCYYTIDFTLYYYAILPYINTQFIYLTLLRNSFYLILLRN